MASWQRAPPREADDTSVQPGGKAQAVRLVRTLRAELGSDHGTVQRAATQLGYGTESVRSWVRQADIDDGHMPGMRTVETARIEAFEQENRAAPD